MRSDKSPLDFKSLAQARTKLNERNEKYIEKVVPEDVRRWSCGYRRRHDGLQTQVCHPSSR
jgi:hypothetical protein